MNRYKTSGVCSKEIKFDVKDNKVSNVEFVGGCNGNLKGISILVNDMDVDSVIEKLKNVKCGQKSTSCPAQLAHALEVYKKEH